MTSLGQNWRQKVATQQNDLSAIQQDIAEREQHAVEWISKVESNDLEAGIASCISNGSDSLALPMPKAIIVTDAFRSFMTSLTEKDLLADVALEGDEEGRTYLLVSPAV